MAKITINLKALAIAMSANKFCRICNLAGSDYRVYNLSSMYYEFRKIKSSVEELLDRVTEESFRRATILK